MTKLRIGRLSYLNALPLYGGFLKGEIEVDVDWKESYPSSLDALLEKGELDLSLVSSSHYITHQDELELLPGYGIAAGDEVLSVLLYIRHDVESLSGQQIAVTGESATSVQLLKVLCERFWDRQPEYVPLPSLEQAIDYPAFLLIGDDALNNPSFASYHTMDLATAWHEKTALPMTFAVFAARKEAMAKRSDEIMGFMQRLEASYKWGQRNEGVILEMAQERSGLSLQKLKAYYPLIRHRLGKEELAGLKTFASLCETSLV